MTASSAGAPVPAWLARTASVGWRVLVVIGLVGVLAWIAAELSSVTAAVMVALVVAATLAPSVGNLRAAGASRPIAAAIGSLLGIAVAIAAILVIALALLPDAGLLVAKIGEGIDDLRALFADIGVPAAISDALDRVVEAIVGFSLTSIAGSAVSVGTVLVLAGFLTYFLLADGDLGWQWLVGGFGPRQAELLNASAAAGLRRVAGYLRRTVALAAIDALVVAVVLLVLGQPLAGPLAVLTFFGGFVPYIGTIVTTTVVGLVTLAYGGPLPALLVVGALVAASVIAARVLDRTAIGRRADIHPAVVLAAIPFGAALFGVLGIVALLPVSLLLATVGRALATALGPEFTSGIPAPPPGVPGWLDRLAAWSWRVLVVIAVIAIVIAFVVWVPLVSVSIVLALVIAATLASVAGWLRRMGWSPALASFAATAGAVVAIVVSFGATVLLSLGPIQEIVATAAEGADDTGIGWLGDIVERLGSGLIGDVAGLVRGLAVATFVVVLSMLLAYFFLRDGAAWWARTAGRAGPRRAEVREMGVQAVRVLGGYMVGTAIISAFGAVTSALIMILLGLPLAVPIGVLTFFSGFIPYIGSFASTAVATLVAVAVGTTTDVIVMLAWTVVFNLVQGSFITPIVYGRTMRLHPAIILLAIPAGNEIAGILGMFLVVPFVAIVATLWRPVLRSIEAETGDRASPGGSTAVPALDAAQET